MAATKVREATLIDVPTLATLGRALHAESPRYRVMSFSVSKIEALARRLLTGTMTTPPIGGVFVAERDGEVIGMVAGFVTAHWFSDERMLSDYTVYVKPQHRRVTTAFVKMIRALEAWGREQGARYSLVGVSTGLHSLDTKLMYERMGYTTSGEALLKEL